MEGIKYFTQKSDVTQNYPNDEERLNAIEIRINDIRSQLKTIRAESGLINSPQQVSND